MSDAQSKRKQAPTKRSNLPAPSSMIRFSTRFQGLELQLEHNVLNVPRKFNNNKFVWIVTAIVVCILFVVGAMWRYLTSAEPDLLIEGLHFGEVYASDDFTWVIRVKNRSSSIIKLLHFKTSCNCTEVIPESVTLTPKQSSDLHVAIDLGNRLDEHALEQKSPFLVRIVVQVQRESHSYQDVWDLRGTVLNDIIPEKRTVNFPIQLIAGERTVRSADIVLYSFEKLANWKIQPEQDCPFQFNLCSAAKNLKKRRIKVDIRPDLPAGYYRSDVSVVASRADGSTTYPAVITVVGVVLDRIVCFPDSLELGPVDVGIQATGEVILRSRLGRLIKVTGVSLSDDDKMSVSITPVETESSIEWRAHISIEVTERGDISEKINFLIRETDGEDGGSEYSFPLTVRAYGL